MRRRDFIKVIGGTAAWPFVARAQQPTSTIRRVGILFPESASAAERGLLEAFRQGLKEMGWVEGQNIAFEYRSADGNGDALPKDCCRAGSITIGRHLGGRHPSNPGCKKCDAIHSNCNGNE